MPDLTFLCHTALEIGCDGSITSARPEVWTAERCFIREILNESETPEASLAAVRVPSGGITALHAIAGITERYLIQSGLGQIEVDGVKIEVGPNDVVVVPAGAAQRIANLGRRDLKFICLCTPRFRPECYRALEV